MNTGKMVKRGAAVLLSAALLAQPFVSFAASGDGEPEVLYTVNCATTDPSVVPEGYAMGACQSKVDQALAEDSTGYSWGYLSGDPYSELIRTGEDPAAMTATSWYLSDGWIAEEENAGIRYNFQLPEDVEKVQVTVGVYIPQWWDDRTVAVELEGQAAGQMSCADGVLAENTFVTSVTDGELNFAAKSVDYSNRKADPMLSYLIVEEVVDNGELTITGATAASHSSGDLPQYAYDGNPSTMWHSSWDGDYPTVEDGLWITLDLGQEVSDVSRITYLPRQNHDTNGTYTGYEVLVSSNGTDFTKVAEGTWTADKTLKTATFPAVSARYVQLKATATQGNNDGENNKYASAAEIQLFHGDQWNRQEAQTALGEAVALADEYLASDNGKEEIELRRLNTLVETARPLADSSYLAVKEEIGTLADDITSEVTRLQNNQPYKTYDSIMGTDCDGEQYLDNNGNVIQAHGGQIQKWGDTYYWYGEDKSNEYAPVGVHLYTSKDLYNWTDEGVVLKTMDSKDQFETDPYFNALYGDLTEEEQQEIFYHIDANTAVVERPKVIYNESTGKYVMWFHADGPLRTGEGGAHAYWKAEAAVAVSDTPEGPFTLVGSYRLHTREGYTGNQGMARDMNLFVDEGVDANGDGVDDAYIIYSSEENQTMYISRLNADYTYLDVPQGEAVEGEDFTANFVGISREAPAMFKYNDTYYLMTSGCTGWSPNPAQYAVSDSPLGPWTVMGNPCVDSGSDTTYKTQSTCIVPIDPENGKYMYMGDRWYPPYNLPVSDSRYVWLPVDFGFNGAMILHDEANWKLEEELGRQPAFYLDGIFVDLTDDFEEYVQNMPNEMDIVINGEVEENVPVTWEVNEDKMIQGTLTGTLGGENPLLAGRSFQVNVNIYGKNIEYFIDCNNPDSEFLEYLNAFDSNVRNEVGDQPYDEESGWGYVGTIGSPQNNDGSTFGVHNGSDEWSYGWFGGATKPLLYNVKLEAGEYELYSGYQEWWNTGRTMKFSAGILNDDGTVTELASKEFSISGTTTADAHSLRIVLEEPATVQLSVSKVSGGDPVLSWLGVEKIPDPAEIITGLEITSMPDKTEYYVGETFDPTGLEAQLVFKDGHTELCTEWTVDVADMTTPGEKVVVVAYGEFTTEIFIHVRESMADKSALEELVKQAEAIDLNLYTEESAVVFTDALKAAKTVLADESLSEDDQAQVDQAASELKEAMESLVLKEDTGTSDGDDSSDDTSKPDDGEEQKPSPETGDQTGVLLMLAVAAMAVSGTVLIRKKSIRL